jgi:hypothetical protein
MSHTCWLLQTGAICLQVTCAGVRSLQFSLEIVSRAFIRRQERCPLVRLSIDYEKNLLFSELLGPQIHSIGKFIQISSPPWCVRQIERWRKSCSALLHKFDWFWCLRCFKWDWATTAVGEMMKAVYTMNLSFNEHASLLQGTQWCV